MVPPVNCGILPLSSATGGRRSPRFHRRGWWTRTPCSRWTIWLRNNFTRKRGEWVRRRARDPLRGSRQWTTKSEKGKMRVKKDGRRPIKKIKSRGRREISFNAPTPIFFDIVCARCVDAVYRVLFFSHSFVIGVVVREMQRNTACCPFFFCVGLIGRSRVTLWAKKKKKITKFS